jgi:uncharacterized protein
MGATRVRHVPERRCLGCGSRGPKGSLARFVAVPEGDGHVLMRDDEALRGGRGLYVCRRAECFERAVSRRAFGRGARIAGGIAIDPGLGAGLGEEE